MRNILKKASNQPTGACCVTHEGVPNHVNLPHMGGKCVVHWNKTGKNTYHNIIESEKMGKWILDEEYTEEGIKSTLSKDGKSFTECWKRAACVDGLYKYKSSTGLKFATLSVANLMKKPLTRCPLKECRMLK